MSEGTIPAQQTGKGPDQAQVTGRLAHAREFVAAMLQLCAQDRGARAALRTGVGKHPDEARRMHRYVAVWLPSLDEDTQRAYYAVAALIAARRDTEAPNQTGRAEKAGKSPGSRFGESLGVAFAAAVARPRDGLRESSAEMRLNLLTRQSVAGIHRHLPAAVRQLCDKKTQPDWAQLVVDLRGWRDQRGRTGRRWLQDFYRARRQAEIAAAKDAAEQADATDADRPAAAAG
ncbi:type I-E CRISPR-associated protein Cse2/CasB [Streptomyces violaceusniger]|uniref:CRISPR-associated protein, Cse2 family n=1 Tax=Streptomyces violaceusniger (strain Tu 4113) TaxID=653045 RepID=G2PH29_STRV4|nr:type I-E CRISPR-associated protein Cse2/CasB [Streptomyces violaceusniger]AEM88603.1 CRISPR-associated protein, Cse2 family [Streptomyces violaceusniger Tu 4113]